MVIVTVHHQTGLKTLKLNGETVALENDQDKSKYISIDNIGKRSSFHVSEKFWGIISDFVVRQLPRVSEFHREVEFCPEAEYWIDYILNLQFPSVPPYESWALRVVMTEILGDTLMDTQSKIGKYFLNIISEQEF